MTKKTIWQKLNNKLNTKIKIFRNTAILRVNAVHIDKVTGAVQTTNFEKTIICTQPERVQSGMIDGVLVFDGDMQLPVDYLTVKEIHRDLEENIDWSESTGVFHPGLDTIEFGGVVYTIRSVIPGDWMNNMPGQYLLILKGVAAK